MFCMIAGCLSRPQEDVQGMMELRDIENVGCQACKDRISFSRVFIRRNENIFTTQLLGLFPQLKQTRNETNVTIRLNNHLNICIVNTDLTVKLHYLLD